MSRLLHFDRALLATISGLVVMGLVMIYSSSAVVALTHKGSPNFFLLRQAMWAVVGFAALFVTLKIDYHRWKNRKVILGLFAVEMCLLLTALVSPAINGSHRWIRVWKMTIQPSESAKLVVVLLTAYLLDKRLEENREWTQMLVPFSALIGSLCALIIIEPDLGTVVVLCTAAGVTLFVGGLPWKWTGLASVAGIVGLFIAIIALPYRLHRLFTFLHPNSDQLKTGFQAHQSLVAVGSGGFFGNWFEGGSQKFLFLPQPHTDFIYAMVAEGFGLVGAMAVLGLFLYLGYRGFLAMRGAPDPFGAYLAVGITAWIVFQALIHIMVTLTLLPTKGLPLPLFSYGGSNLVVAMAGLGILLNVSQHE